MKRKRRRLRSRRRRLTSAAFFCCCCSSFSEIQVCKWVRGHGLTGRVTFKKIRKPPGRPPPERRRLGGRLSTWSRLGGRLLVAGTQRPIPAVSWAVGVHPTPRRCPLPIFRTPVLPFRSWDLAVPQSPKRRTLISPLNLLSFHIFLLSIMRRTFISCQQNVV